MVKALNPRRLPALALFLLCACSSKPAPGRSESRQIFQDLTLSETSKGIAQWSLGSKEAILRDESGEIDLKSPDVRLFSKGRPGASARARKGRYLEKSGNFELKGSVVADSALEQATLRTELLEYVASAGQFRTDQPVVVERQGVVVRGRGLVASRDLSEIRILHQEARVQ